MARPIKHINWAALTLAIGFLPSVGRATVLYWDSSGDPTGVIDGAGANNINGTGLGNTLAIDGTNVWDAVTSRWWANGGLSNQLFVFGDDAVFHGNNINQDGVILVSGAVAAHSLTFRSSFTLNPWGTSADSLDFVNTNLGDITVEAGATGTINVTIIGDNTHLQKKGTGTLVLGGANVYESSTTVEAGVLRITHGQALGIGTGGTSIQNGAALELDGSSGDVVVLSESLALRGAGISGGGSLRSVAGDNTWAGGIALGTNSSIGVDAGQLTLAGAVSGSGQSLTKVGAGTLILSAGNSYSGGTAIDEGTLLVNNPTGSATGTGAVVINSGGTLAGSGMITGPVTINSGGTISPGASPGTLSTGAQTWGDGGVYLWEINDLNGTRGSDPGWDWLNITGSLNLTATVAHPFVFDITSLTGASEPGALDGFDASTDYHWTIASASDGISGFEAFSYVLDIDAFLPNDLLGGQFTLTRSGSDLILNFTPASELVVPLPLTAWIGLSGIVTFGILRASSRRRWTDA